jgi:recombination protein RecA
MAKKHGQGVVINGASYKSEVRGIPTGALTFDLATGIGGFPEGRISEVYGPESSGKTSLVLAVMGEINRRGGLVGFIDVEHAVDLNWAKAYGVDPQLVELSQPDSAEQALNVLDDMVRSGLFKVVCLDSIAALASRKELEGEIGDSTVGVVARLMGQLQRSTVPAAKKTATTVILINQIREKIGVMFGSPETTPGGRATRYAASMRVDVRRVDWIKNGQEPVGINIRAKIVKNKCAAPGRVADIELLFDEGISKAGSVVDVAVALKLIDKAGAWFTFDGQRFQGRTQVKNFLRDNPEKMDALVNKIMGNDQYVDFETATTEESNDA